MVFSVVITSPSGSTIWRFKTEREDVSAEVGTPEDFNRLLYRMGDMVEVISVDSVEL